MSKPRKQKKSAPKTAQASPEKKSPTVTIILALIALAGPFAGAYIQDRFDILKTNRQLAITYSEAATLSAATVESEIANLFELLSNPDNTVSSDQVKNLRTALLKLRSDAEQLAIQVGNEQTPFNEYVGAMADLVDAAQGVTGSADAAPLIEAVSAFYLNKKKFDTDIAQRHRPS